MPDINKRYNDNAPTHAIWPFAPKPRTLALPRRFLALPAMYTPGLHCLLSLDCPDEPLLRDMEAWLQFIRPLLPANGLRLVGEAAHRFEGAGFTVALCLEESHICIHTWPEYGFLTLDIYLCNYQKSNENIVRYLAEKNVVYFVAQIRQQQEIFR